MSAMTTPEYLMANAKNHGNETAITAKGSMAIGTILVGQNFMTKLLL